MTRIRTNTAAVAGLLGVALLAPRPTAAQPAVAPPPAAAGDAVKSIELPVIPPNLPPGPGLSTVVGSCTVCHTPAYVTMQPPFPRKTWEATVEKMRTVYGAPIQPALVPEIVNYLMAVRGKPDTAPASAPKAK